MADEKKPTAVTTLDLLRMKEQGERIVALEQQLREVETQFRHQDRLIRLLWQRIYQEPMPAAMPNGASTP